MSYSMKNILGGKTYFSKKTGQVIKHTQQNISGGHDTFQNGKLISRTIKNPSGIKTQISFRDAIPKVKLIGK